jgi:hypothetical protein
MQELLPQGGAVEKFKIWLHSAEKVSQKVTSILSENNHIATPSQSHGGHSKR